MTAPAAELLRVEDLSVDFSVSSGLWGARRTVHAVQGVGFALGEAEILGVVGESGCGKSTLGRAVLNLIRPTAGRVLWRGREPAGESREAQRLLRREMTAIFQDPLASLDPRMSVGDLVAEPLDIFAPSLSRDDRRRRVLAMLERVGLPVDAYDRYPHQFSGGQCQRIGIARALMSGPRMIVCDEAVSALDVSIQAQIIALLADLSREAGVSLLFISHNLAVVRRISHRVMVLYLGKLMEIAPADALYAAPRHPYTRALLSAVPVPDPEIERTRTRIRLAGDLPSPLDPPKGCVFHTRCPHADDRCRAEIPLPAEAGPGHRVACHRWRELF